MATRLGRAVEAIVPVREGAFSDSEYQKWGYIDVTGRYVVYPRFSWAGHFRGGLAKVNWTPNVRSRLGDLCRLRFTPDDRAIGYVDRYGKVVFHWWRRRYARE